MKRSDYFQDILNDLSTVTQDPQVIAACITNDALNGIRKALLDISESNRVIADELRVIANAATA